jgi:hypothetical protein
MSEKEIAKPHAQLLGPKRRDGGRERLRKRLRLP